MEKICHAVPVLASFRSTRRENDPVYGRLQQAIRPVREEIGNVDEDWRHQVGFRARWRDGDGGPHRIGRQDLKARLRWSLE